MLLCRACLTFEDNLFPIKEYKEDFIECVGVEVNDTDLLCPTCMRKLNEAKAFRSLARRSARILQLKSEMKIVEVKEEPPDPEPADEDLIEERLDDYDDDEHEVVILEEHMIHQENDDDDDDDEIVYEEVSATDFKAEFIEHEEDETEDLNDSFTEILIEDDGFPFRVKKAGKVIDKARSMEYARRGKLAWSNDVRAHLIRECPYCFYEDKNKRVMMEHIQRHIDEAGGLECDHCGRRFFKKQRMKEHLIRTFYGTKKVTERQQTGVLQCCFCPENFTNSTEYEQHIHDRHPEKQEEVTAADLICDICGQTFPKRYLLNNHTRSTHKVVTKHRTIKPKSTFKCTYCDKSYQSRRSRMYHEMNHTGDRPYICATCSRAFKSAKALKNHEFVHSDEKNFECYTCGKRYRTKELLKGHEIIHTNVFKYTCEVCGMKFRRSCHLTEHQLAHSDRRDFSCAMCGTAYKARNTLRRHLRQHAQKLGVDDNSYVIEEKDGKGVGKVVVE